MSPAFRRWMAVLAIAATPLGCSEPVAEPGDARATDPDAAWPRGDASIGDAAESRDAEVDGGHGEDAGAEDNDGGPADAGPTSDAGGPASATIVSAYLGLLDASALLASRLARTSGCAQTAGDDAMPVVFSEHLAAASVEPTDFAVVTTSGRVMTPACATLRPATGDDERRTVLVTGQLGDASDPPARVELRGALDATDADGNPLVTLTGLVSPPVRRSSEGPVIELALRWPEGPRAACGDGSGRVQLTWSGGVTARLNREFSDAQLAGFFVDVVDSESGARRRVNPVAFEDLDDGDNHLDLCVAKGLEPVEVSVAADIAFDPTNQPNPATTARVVTP